MSEQRYTVAKAAAIAGIGRSTVRLWGRELAAVMSAHANPEAGVQRRYTPADCNTLHTAHVMRAEGQAWPAIVDAISAGRLILPEAPESPPEAPDAPGSALIPVSQFLAVSTALSASEATLAATTVERDRLLQELSDERAALLEATSRAAASEAALAELRKASRPWFKRWFGRE